MSFFRPPGIPFWSDNKFYIELSDPRGYFSLPVVLTTSTGTREKTLEVELPANIDLSRDYAVRVRSTRPAYIGNPTPLKYILGAGVITASNGILSSSGFGADTYQWLSCDNNFEPISGANDATYAPLSDGSYALEISENGCIDTTACFDFSMTSGLAETTDNSLSITPNPASDYLFINHKSLIIKEIEIVSLSGNTIKTFAPNQEKFDISELSPAVYFVKVVTEERMFVKKIIKI